MSTEPEIVKYSEIDASRDYLLLIAIEPVNSDQLHLGVVYKDKSCDPMKLHFAWEFCLKNELLSRNDVGYLISPRFGDALRLQNSIGYCRLLWRNRERGKMSYGFSFPMGRFDNATAKMLDDDAFRGFTCASFVLSLFEGMGFLLADLSTWPTVQARPEDLEWQKMIIDKLASYYQMSGIIFNELRDVGQPRYRPEEVAACGVLAPPAADYNRVLPISIKIRQHVLASLVPNDCLDET